jgi:hypothetical protein
MIHNARRKEAAAAARKRLITLALQLREEHRLSLPEITGAVFGVAAQLLDVTAGMLHISPDKVMELGNAEEQAAEGTVPATRAPNPKPSWN